jgi:Flp pilus assembly protein TadD
MAKQVTHKRKRSVSVQASATPKARTVASFGRPEILIAAGLTIMTLAIYAQVIGHQFISLDDDLYIKENSMVNRGVTPAGIAWAFTTFYAANWHPLTWIAHMIDSQLFGMNAGGHLLVNALIHAANTLLVFWLLLRTTHARWPSALIAALFSLHPLHVESVAWAAERKDTLATFFGLLSLIAYTRYAEARSRSLYAWTAMTLALGLLAKPMLVTWPFVMLLLDYWPLRRFDITSPREVATRIWRLVREKLPLFAIGIVSAVITSVAQSHGGTVRTFVDVPIGLRLSNALVSYAKYLLLTFWPHDLAVYYPFDLTGIPAWQIIGATFVLVGTTALCVFQAKTRPYLIVGWFWFIGTLVPVIGIVQVGGQAMADRYSYIPSIGLFIALVFGLADAVAGISDAGRPREVRPDRDRRSRLQLSPKAFVVATTTGAVLLVLATLTYAQIHRWRDSVTLFQHTLAVTPPNLIVEHNLGLVLGRSGSYDEAAAHFEKALQIKPDFYDALLNMGITRSQQGRLPEAIDYFQAAIRSRSNASKAHMELGLALAKQNRNDSARDEMRRAVELAPEDADTRANLGLILMRLRKIPQALDELHEAVRLKPESAEAHNNLGLALLASGKSRESIPEFETALRLKPELNVAADNLRRAQAQLGK